jgi:hypothetical protein
VVAELLRLKARLLVNAFRVPGTAAWATFGILLAGGGVALLWTGAGLAADLDAVTRHRVVVVVGVLVSLGAFLVPLLVARSHLVHPRALRLFGFRGVTIAGAILLMTLVGPALLLVPIALAPLLVWTGSAATTAAFAVPLIVLEGIFAARVGVGIGALLPYRPAVAAVIRIVAALIFAGGLVVLGAHLVPTIAQQLPGSWWPVVLTVVFATAPLRDPAITDALTA